MRYDLIRIKQTAIKQRQRGKVRADAGRRSRLYPHGNIMKTGCLGALFLVLAGCTPGAETYEPPAKPQAEAPQAQVPAQVPNRDAYSGAAIAQMVCVQCHDVGVAGAAPAIKVGAPDFVAIANGDGVTAESLGQWMRSSHPAMPNFLFNDSNIGALAAYIMSLRKTP